MLLVLDNFEHLVAAAPLVADLLVMGPHLKILVTSRAVLHVYGEHEFPLPPLALPDPRSLPSLDVLSHYPAIADPAGDRKSTRLNSSHANISYAVFCLKKKKKDTDSSCTEDCRQRC